MALDIYFKYLLYILEIFITVSQFSFNMFSVWYYNPHTQITMTMTVSGSFVSTYYVLSQLHTSWIKLFINQTKVFVYQNKGVVWLDVPHQWPIMVYESETSNELLTQEHYMRLWLSGGWGWKLDSVLHGMWSAGHLSWISLPWKISSSGDILRRIWVRWTAVPGGTWW